MILDIPTPLSASDRPPLATIEVLPNSPDSYSVLNVVTVNVLPSDLIARPLIVYIPLASPSYHLDLVTTAVTVRIFSTDRTLLRYYLDCVFADKDVTLEDTKAKFPELFI